MPRSLRARILFRRGSSQLALGWLALCLVGALTTFPHVEWPVKSYDASTRGRVFRVEQGGRVDSSVYQVDASFVDADGRAHTVRSYGAHPPRVGDEVDIDYDADDPDTARIDDMRARPLPLWLAALISLGVALGLLPLWVNARRERPSLRALEAGALARARVLHVEENVSVVDESTEADVTMEFTTRDGRKTRFVIRTESENTLDRDGDHLVAYDPIRPEDATTLDHLPGKPQLGDDGVLTATAHDMTLLVTPIVCVGLAIATLIATVS